MSAIAGIGAVEYPVAVRDQDLGQASSLRVETYEVCTLCGQRFGIGYLQPLSPVARAAEPDLLPNKLKDILAKDHRQERQHKPLIELDN